MSVVCWKHRSPKRQQLLCQPLAEELPVAASRIFGRIVTAGLTEQRERCGPEPESSLVRPDAGLVGRRFSSKGGNENSRERSKIHSRPVCCSNASADQCSAGDKSTIGIASLRRSLVHTCHVSCHPCECRPSCFHPCGYRPCCWHPCSYCACCCRPCLCHLYVSHPYSCRPCASHPCCCRCSLSCCCRRNPACCLGEYHTLVCCLVCRSLKSCLKNSSRHCNLRLEELVGSRSVLEHKTMCVV